MKKKVFFIIAALAAVATLSTGCKKDEPEENGYGYASGTIQTTQTATTTTACPHCGKATYYVKYSYGVGIIIEAFLGSYVESGHSSPWELRVNNSGGTYHAFWVDETSDRKIRWTCDSCQTTINAEYKLAGNVININ